MLLTSLLACSLFDTRSTVTVVNDDKRSLGPVVVEVDGEKVFEGMLTPGQRRTVELHPKRDASFRVYGHGPSGSFDEAGIGYTTPGDGQDHVFHLRGNVVRYGEGFVHTNRVQLLVDAPALQTFLHPEVPGNLPLTVALPRTLASEGRAARFHGQPIRVTRSARVVVEEDGVGFSIAVPSEGVVGSVRFYQDERGWVLSDLELAER